jgi:hypothetical protein
MFSDLLGALPHIRAGKLRVLGVTTKERAPAAPDLPTLQEAGVADYDASAWQMLVAPAKTPKEIVDRLNAELNAIVREPPTMSDINGRGHIAIATPAVAELAALRAVRDRALGKSGGGRGRQRHAVRARSDLDPRRSGTCGRPMVRDAPPKSAAADLASKIADVG